MSPRLGSIAEDLNGRRHTQVKDRIAELAWSRHNALIDFVLIPSTIVRGMSTSARGDTRDAGTLLFGKTRRQLLAWLYGHPDERFYLRQLARQTGAAQGAMQRELTLLSQVALVTRTAEGRQVYFQANRESPIFSELQQLLVKTAGAGEVVREALAPLSSVLRIAFIYGSAAKGTLKASSDLDLLVVGSAAFRDVAAALDDAQRRLGRDVSPTVYPTDEFVRKIRTKHHFLTTVLREPKIFVIGSEHDLSRLAEERVGARTRDKRTGDRRSPRRRRA
jgi:predicted nucleotidyltransferase